MATLLSMTKGRGMTTNDANPQHHQRLGVIREDTDFTGPRGAALHGRFFVAASESPKASAMFQHGSSGVDEHRLDNHTGILQAPGRSASPSTVVA